MVIVFVPFQDRVVVVPLPNHLYKWLVNGDDAVDVRNPAPVDNPNIPFDALEDYLLFI